MVPRGPEPRAIGGGGKEAVKLVRGDPSWEQDLLWNRQGAGQGRERWAPPGRQRQHFLDWSPGRELAGVAGVRAPGSVHRGC